MALENQGDGSIGAVALSERCHDARPCLLVRPVHHHVPLRSFRPKQAILRCQGQKGSTS